MYLKCSFLLQVELPAELFGTEVETLGKLPKLVPTEGEWKQFLVQYTVFIVI